MSQPDATFLQAFNSVRRRHSVEEWISLPPRQITQEIYAEMRRIDLIQAQAILRRSVTKRKAMVAKLVPVVSEAAEQTTAPRPAKLVRARAA